MRVPEPGTEPTDEASVEALVRATAHRVGITAPEVEWTNAEAAMARAGGRVIRLRRNMLSSADAARFVALHELGHVALGHLRPGPSSATVVVMLAAMVLPLVAGAVVALRMGIDWGVGVALGVPLGAVLVAIAARLMLQSREYAADAWAAINGGVLTEGVARAAFKPARPSVQVAESLISTHPPIFRRVRRVQELLDRNDAP